MKKLTTWLLIGLFLRVLLIPSYVHPDIRGYNLAAYLISQKNLGLTFYDYISTLPESHQLVQLYHDDLFIYPPLAYLTPALFMKVLSPIYPWPVFDQLMYDINIALSNPQMSYLAFLLKSPFILAEILCLILIRKQVPDKFKFIASLAWIFNPVVLYSSYLVSQFDVFIALFLLLSLHLATINRPILSSVSLGVAAAFKPFPLFLLPFVNKDSSVLSRILSVSAGLLTFSLLISPYLSSPGFRHYALLADQSQKLFSAKIMISQTSYISIFLLGLGLLAWFNYRSFKALPLWAWYASVPLLFYSISHFHPQWLVWGMPFLVISYAIRPSTRPALLALLALYFLTVLTFEQSLNTDIIRWKYSLADQLVKLKLFDTFLSAVKSLFAATAIYLIFQWTKESQS